MAEGPGGGRAATAIYDAAFRRIVGGVRGNVFKRGRRALVVVCLFGGGALCSPPSSSRAAGLAKTGARVTAERRVVSPSAGTRANGAHDHDAKIDTEDVKTTANDDAPGNTKAAFSGDGASGANGGQSDAGGDESGANDGEHDASGDRGNVAEFFGWSRGERQAIRGITVGPIESALHPNRGYGSPAFEQTLRDAKRLGATWISLTPFGRVYDWQSSGISLDFETPFAENRRAMMRAIGQAHALGLRVLLVPHLWVESGGWRGEIDPGSTAAWDAWSRNYRAFLLTWAAVARDAHADMLSVGVELRSWLTTTHAASFKPILTDVRRIYPGLLTYAGNWDDIEQTVILGDLDLIALNAFFPLADREGASPDVLAAGGRKVRERLSELAEAWHKPILFNEFGYTTRADPAVRPWEWPDKMTHVVADQAAQAEAYRALLAAFTDAPWFAGFFVWRLYADPDDASQEAEWGFSPRGKQAELVLRDAFTAHFAADAPRAPGSSLFRDAAVGVGRF